MRVLVIPEVYRPGDATACGTLNDAVSWAEQWLERDDRLHVYWLLPPRADAGYDAEYVLADRDRVTLVEAAPLMAGRDDAHLFTEGGYTAAELSALREAIYDAGAYVDVVVDQRRTGRATLYKWLLAHTDHWAAAVRPFDVVANVHDLQVPRKYRWCAYRNGYQGRLAVCGAVFADGIWFSAGVDARRLREHATDVLDAGVVDEALEGAVEIGSPLDVDVFEGSFADEPRWLHVAGSVGGKKNADAVLGIAERLHERFGIRTVLSSMDPIPDRYLAPDWIDAYPEADRATFQRALDRGDLAVCASDYETLARTPFEQAASGQVLVLRDAPWIYDCVPEDYPLASDLDGLGGLAVRAVERWEEAVAATRRLLAHVRRVRSPERVGRRTYRDLVRRVREKRRRYAPGAETEVVARALRETEHPVRLDELIEATAAFTDDGRPLPARESSARTDAIYALRRLGYADRGSPGMPTFERTDAGASRRRP